MRWIVQMLLAPSFVAVVCCAAVWSQEAAPSDTCDAPTVSEHWAFQRLSRPALPEVTDAAAARTPVDRFILARLEEKGLALSAEADRHTLCRRLYFDLAGLPPSPEEIAEFVADSAPDAYERLVDCLLASPRFGERWARHWLDEAGYVDVMGGDNDAATVELAENKWFYRDWVVRALNEDKPWREFIAEQIAGDELCDWREAATFTGEMRDTLVATGFLRTAGDDTDENELNTLDIRYGVVQRTAEVLSSNLLGLTVQCAKCHDHKYEPILQRDYYRLVSLLKPALDPDRWLQPKDRALADVSPAEKAKIDAQNAELERQGDGLQRQIAEIRERYEQKLFDMKLAAIPEPIREDTKIALRTEKEKRSEVQEYLVEKFEAQTRVKAEEVAAALSAEDKGTIEGFERRVADVKARRRGYGRIHAIYDVGPPTPTRILERGEPTKPGEEVQPGFVSVLAAPLSPPSERGARGGLNGASPP
ncbi:MAG: DUF1549 domain-containing protein, partial [Planctomycetia bacterium]|nr:DUF1549 domain-containing protein [Planctomycetia bacterium]